MHDATQDGGQRVQWYHPGEVVVVARVPRAAGIAPSTIQANVHNALRERARGHFVDDAGPTRSFVFDAPDEPNSLVFLFHKLADTASPRAVKDAVENVHLELDALRTAEFEIVTAMPHWHLRAHEAHSGASPGSHPRPVYPDQVPGGWKYRYYQPVNHRLDLMHRVNDTEPVRVAVLDSRLDLGQARMRASTLRNEQLGKTVDWLQKHGQADPHYAHEVAEIAKHHPAASSVRGGSEPAPYAIPDHGLFVAGLIHGIAPRVPLTLEPVLDDMGVGDLSLLLHGLQRVLARKRPEDPQIVNLSLGFLPHPARLPAAWYGLRRPHDALYLHADEMYDPQRNDHWVAANRSQVGRTIDLLEAGLRELSAYLNRNNCLVIAAVGNDSLAQVEAHHARMEPRLPARFDSVLGVAATTSDPRQAARYSNVGDERELGDHLATFGGNASDAREPEDGVIGIYSGDFPDQRPNETGWAWWSGTSFATGIVSGVAANFWADRRNEVPGLDAASVLSELHDEVSVFGPYVPALRTPAMEVRGRWGR
jgi:hypothetical protein